jgi:hypothetical protein
MRAITLSAVIIVGVIPAFSRPSFAGAVPPLRPIIFSAAHRGLSPPLRDILALPPSGARHEQEDEPRAIPFPRGTRPGPDGALQKLAPTRVRTSDLLNFPGVGVGDYGFKTQVDRPDANGSVGATQYVQFVNASFAVFDKSTGALLLGPVDALTLWSSLGGVCGIRINGDPIAQYDKLANRWVLSAIATTNDNPPFAQCVAVSQTNDATGAYYLYEFDYGSVLPDYDKLGVWPDAYYATFNTFNPGSLLCALDRNSMLSGLPATEQCYQLGSSDYLGVLPSDVDGTTPPPAGSPNYLINFGVNSLNEWQFHVDWANPDNTSLTGPISIPVKKFTPTCGGTFGRCVPEEGGGGLLTAMGDRLMYRFAYRNFGDHESLLVNHTVVAGTQYGVRWYELRTPLAPTVYQSGTYAPGKLLYRWMGSIAMDKAGDIAVGYSASDSTEYPSIRYTGRTPDTALGKLLGEKVVKASGGGHGDNEWGDYTGMAVDPVDDCTFYYTNEYMKSTTTTWSTEINAFRFRNCK